MKLLLVLMFIVFISHKYLWIIWRHLLIFLHLILQCNHHKWDHLSTTSQHLMWHRLIITVGCIITSQAFQLYSQQCLEFSGAINYYSEKTLNIHTTEETLSKLVLRLYSKQSTVKPVLKTTCEHRPLLQNLSAKTINSISNQTIFSDL